MHESVTSCDKYESKRLSFPQYFSKQHGEVKTDPNDHGKDNCCVHRMRTKHNCHNSKYICGRQRAHKLNDEALNRHLHIFYVLACLAACLHPLLAKTYGRIPKTAQCHSDNSCDKHC